MSTRFNRRTFLRGSGVSLALPFVEALLPREAWGQDLSRPQRFLAFYVPNGIHMAAWTPVSSGADYALTPILQPLEELKDDILVVSGLDNLAARPDGPGDHAAGTGSFLTAAHCFKTDGANIRNGISLDQRIANHVGDQTRFPSLELGAEGGGSTGGCDSGYSCAYSRNIAWSSESTPVYKEANPQIVFDRLFQGHDTTLSQAQIAKHRHYRRSVLDFVLEDANRLRGRLGPTDRRKIEEYLAGIRALENLIDSLEDGPVCEAEGRPGGNNDVHGAERIRRNAGAMIELLVLAFQCDLTRTATFMLANGGSNVAYTFLDGVHDGHHEISHHMGLQENFDRLVTINTWEVGLLATLLARMKGVEEGEGTMLDNSLVFFSSEVEDGNAHRHTDLPILLAGRAGGQLQPGRHISYTDQTSIANLFISIMQLFGVNGDRFGDDGTEPLQGLL